MIASHDQYSVCADPSHKSFCYAYGGIASDFEMDAMPLKLMKQCMAWHALNPNAFDQAHAAHMRNKGHSISHSW